MFPKPRKGTAKRTRKTARVRSERAFRDAVWARDGRTFSDGAVLARCAHCFTILTRGIDAEVDHIKPRSTHPELAFDPSNGRIVCATCNRYLKTHPLEREA